MVHKYLYKYLDKVCLYKFTGLNRFPRHFFAWTSYTFRKMVGLLESVGMDADMLIEDLKIIKICFKKKNLDFEMDS